MHLDSKCIQLQPDLGGTYPGKVILSSLKLSVKLKQKKSCNELFFQLQSKRSLGFESQNLQI